jgi:hypothetical protein
VVAILETFREQNWRDRIGDLLVGQPGPQHLRETVKPLQGGLVEDDRRVAWKVA